MKQILFSIILLIAFVSCSKSDGFQINPDFSSIDNQLNRAKISITTTGQDYYGNTITNKESSNLIVAPSGKGNVTLKYSVTSTNQAKDVRWYIDNTLVGSGNDVQVNFESIGEKKLKVLYKDATTNTEYSKELNLRVHKYIVADVKLTNLDICGQFSVVGSLDKVPVTIDCAAQTVELKNMVYQVSALNNTLLLAFFKSETVTAKLFFIQGSDLNNFKPGTYTVGDNTVTIK